MPVWKDCRFDTFYHDAAADHNYPCEVRLDEREIEICYKWDGEFTRYVGSNDGSGHFQLNAPEVQGHASLHMFPGSSILEGYWREGDCAGMWRVMLSDTVADPVAFNNLSNRGGGKTTSRAGTHKSLTTKRPEGRKPAHAAKPRLGAKGAGALKNKAHTKAK